jgi:hypothetical protein
MVRLHEVLNKVQNPFTSGWGSGVIRTFVQSIDNNVCRDLTWEIEHVAKTLRERGLAGLF